LRRAFGTANNINASVDYYKVLGLKNSADEDQIKKNFYELAKKYHPDSTEGLCPQTKLYYEENFKKISNAYEVLSDKEKKEKYDELRVFDKSMKAHGSNGGSASAPGTDFKAENTWSYTYDSKGNKRKTYAYDESESQPKYQNTSSKRSASPGAGFHSTAYGKYQYDSDKDALWKFGLGTFAVVSSISLLTAGF
jgi:DnaJ-class molecular chaperone